MNRGTGGVQASLIPPLAAIERIEVVRGPMSSLYGSDAMGGVINIITRKVPERLSASVMLGGIVQEDGRYGNSTLGNFWIGAPITSDTVGVQIYGGLNDRAEDEIGRAHVCTPVTNAQIVCRLLLEKKNIKITNRTH